MYKIAIFFLSAFIYINLYNCTSYLSSCPGGWSVSTLNRCYKRVNITAKPGNRTLALNNCHALPNGQNSTLFTIQTQDQLQELKDIFNDIANSTFTAIYIGLTYNNNTGTNQWTWDDNTTLGTFAPWDASAEHSGNTKKCVTTQVGQNGTYTWLTDTCNATETQALCLSPKSTPPIPWGQIQKDIADIKQQLKTVATLTTVFPSGYVYEQLPSQAPPKKLWPSLNWVDVTKNYAGLLFRAEGNGSSKFDDATIVVQGASNFNNFTISTKGLTTVSYSGISDVRNTQMQNGKMSDELCPGVALNSMKLVFDEHDNRPRNTAIRIWKRQ